MAFWVSDGDRSHGNDGGRPYVHGGKRRVSHSDGGDGGESLEFKRPKVILDDFRFEGYEQRPGQQDYDLGNTNRCVHHHHNDLPGSYRSAASDSFNYPTECDYYYHDDHERDIDTTPPPHAPFLHREPIPIIKKRPFYVIRERSPTPELSPISPLGFGPGSAPGSMGPILAPPGPDGPPPPASCAMERTESGISISSNTSQQSFSSFKPEEENESDFMSDGEAARLVCDHVAGHTSGRRRCPDSQHGRVLKTLINPKRGDAPDWPLDNDALRSIFYAANELFFANRLSNRVTWDWSHPASAQYQSHIVGTTAVRRVRPGTGYETLIVLSSPILKDTKYNRRLLISTFLHEMIHSFLFVMCGLKAGEEGGHTDGFRKIAETIDAWVGRGYLRLGEMEADLDQFREHAEREHVSDRGYRGGNEWKMRGVSPWRRWVGRIERDGHDYYPTESHPPRPLQQQPQLLPQLLPQLQQPPGHEDWQWHDRDGLHGRGTRGVGSPYV